MRLCDSIAHFRINHDNQIYSWWFEVLVCGPHRTAAAVAVDQMAGTNAWGISFKGTPGHQPGLPWKMAGIWMESHVMKRWFSYIRWHSWTTAFRRPFAGGGVGHVLTFMSWMWTCRWRTCYAVAAGRCMYSWVGWGGVGWDNNVHGSLFHRSCCATLCSRELCTHGSCYRTVCSLDLCTHASCYVTVCSLELCTHASCYATVCSLELCTHVSWYAAVCSRELCTHASCYATVCSLELCTHGSCYAIACSLELCTHGSCYAPLRDTICAHVVVAFKLIESRS